MKTIKTLFEYQKFQPNARLQDRIDAVAAKYLTDDHEIADDELDVSAAGEVMYAKLFRNNTDAGQTE